VRIIVFLLLFGAFPAKAQNLVPNPSFEDYEDCPYTFGMFGVSHVIGWYLPLNNGSDYYNACYNGPQDGNNVDVPKNYLGYQTARSGVAYAGIGLYGDTMLTFPDQRQYIACRLTQPLEADTMYCAEFFVSLAGMFYDGCADCKCWDVFVA
jgi:OmpA-OmpF porin, OOP family